MDTLEAAIGFLIDTFWFDLFLEGEDMILSLLISVIAVMLSALVFWSQKHAQLERPYFYPRILLPAHPQSDSAERTGSVPAVSGSFIAGAYALQLFCSVQLLNITVSNRQLSVFVALGLTLWGKLVIAGWIWVLLG